MTDVPITGQELDEIEQRAHSASPAPWQAFRVVVLDKTGTVTTPRPAPPVDRRPRPGRARGTT